MAQPGFQTRLSPEALASLGSMEGAYVRPVVEKLRPVTKRPAPKPRPIPGVVAAVAVAAIAFAIHYLPFAPFRVESATGVRRPISAAILAIVAGAIVANLFPITQRIADGAKLIVRRAIPLTIVLTGASLSFANATSIGPRAFVILLVAMTVAMGAAMLLGRMAGLPARTGVLIGAGTAICGNSAIVAVAPLIDAEDRDVMLSVGSINVLGLALMFVAPLIGSALGMTSAGFGIFAGSTIHAVPQAVAAGFAFSAQAGSLATLVKLVRVALLAPMLLVLALLHARKRKDVTVHYARLVPMFLWGFFALFLLNSLRWLPELHFANGAVIPLATALTEAGNWLLTLSMAAMGLEVNLRVLAKVGGAALAVGAGACLAACLAVAGLIRVLL
jgi:uncharacterized integral membrane protein (TIGR00698 family)